MTFVTFVTFVTSSQGEFVACLLALLRHMSDRHYQKLLQAFSRDNLRVRNPAPPSARPAHRGTDPASPASPRTSSSRSSPCSGS